MPKGDEIKTLLKEHEELVSLYMHENKISARDDDVIRRLIKLAKEVENR